MLNQMRYVFILFLCITAGYSYGQNAATEFRDEVQKTGATNIQGNIALTLQPPVTLLRRARENARLTLRFDLGENYLRPAFNFHLKVDFEVTVGGSTSTKSLEIKPDKPEQVLAMEIPAGINQVTVNNLQLTYPLSLAAADQAYIDAVMRFSATASVLSRVDVRLSALPNLAASPVTLLPLNSSTLTNRIQEFRWDIIPSEPVFPNYEIQILKLTNTALAYAHNPNVIETEVDWTKALRVETQSAQKQIRLAVAEGTGFYLWRVRPVGTWFPGGIGNAENYGSWSVAPANGDVLTLTKGGLSLPGAFYLEDPDDGINWIYSRVFTEGNKTTDAGARVDEGLVYADGLLRARQQQNYSPEDDHTLTSQVVLDYLGRPSWSSLPVPVGGKLEGYKKGFVQNSTGQLYTAADFDDDTKVQSPSTVGSVSSAFSYYSENNTDNEIPDAEGYPFSRVLYKNDGTGRVAEQSGVGKVHALGSQTNGQGRTTRILYCSPSNEELVRLFGDEAQLAQSVIKTITIDPNNIASVAYTSKEGKVIATGLATASTNALEPLKTSLLTYTVKNTLDHNELTNQRFVSSKRMAFQVPTDITLSYELDCQAKSWGCMGGDCSYRIRFYLYDLERHIVYGSSVADCSWLNTNTADPHDLDLSALSWSVLESPNALSPPNWNHVLQLDAGEYFVVKEVFSGNDPLFLLQQTAAFADQIQVVLDMVGLWMDDVQNGADYPAFQQKMGNLATALTNYNNSPSTINADAVNTILGLPLGTPVPDGFTLDFSPSASTGNDPDQLTLQTTCCGNTSLSIPKPEQCLPCLEMQPFINNGDFAGLTGLVATHFIQYLGQKLIDNGYYLSLIAPGFSELGLQNMLTNMLLSKYYTGQKKKSGSAWYKAVEEDTGELVFAQTNVNGALEPAPGNTPTELAVSSTSNYPCEQLYNCWMMAVNSLESFEYGDDTRPMNAFDDEHEDPKSEEIYKDEDKRDKKKFTNALLGFAVDAKMRKFNDSDEGLITRERMLAEVNLPNIFMKCVGYQFYGIIDEDEISNNSDIYQEYIQYNALPTDPASMGPVLLEESSLTPIEPRRLVYPYMPNPEWMFKYFVYNVSDKTGFEDVVPPIDDSKDYILPNHKEVEVQSCYNTPCPGQIICNNPCRYDHPSWSSGQMLNFYYLIKGAPVDPENKVTLADAWKDKDDVACPVYADLQSEAESQLELADQSCEGRRSEIRASILAALKAACWEVVECPQNGTNQISLKQVDNMVESAVAACKDIVQDLRESLQSGTNGYGNGLMPTCTEETCYWPDNAGNCVEKKQLRIQYFLDCDQVRLNQIAYWGFVPIIPAAPGSTDPNCIKTTPPGALCNPQAEYSTPINVSASN